MFKIGLKPRPKLDGTHSIVIRFIGKGSRDTKRFDKRVTVDELPSVRKALWSGDRYNTKAKKNPDKVNIKAANMRLDLVKEDVEKMYNKLLRKGTLSAENLYKEFLDRNNTDKVLTVEKALDHKIDKLVSTNSYATIEVYEQTKRRWLDFLRYERRGPIPLEKITAGDIEKFVRYLKQGKGNGGAPQRLQNLKHVFNMAREEELIPFDRLSPFKRVDKKLYKPSGKNAQESLTKEQWEMFKAYESHIPTRMYWKDIFIFMVNCYGINLKDLVLLKDENLMDARTENGTIKVIRYIRKKTKKKKSNAYVEVIVNDFMKEMISKYRDENGLIPVLKDYSLKEGSKEWELEVKRAGQRFNHALEGIAKDLGIPKFSNYAARHTFATLVFWSNKSVEEIGQAMGHSDTSITKGYLKNKGLIVVNKKLNDNL